ncbi:16S rRNA (cytidine(1402)-2'-O)-methyltransferase [Brevibacillus choshinensis]|uniref:Ribosomal RNA small subunit methyltransferase I n=1 Tax=Brevibacillus choshinensis TaxID=54911 RepID=A0ABX7FX70_BRECH|nr:16S rRNA (cytidine(1402)-2'-O)-methyltransferase [Brevibacillus choshinensis]QRG70400.1 16S rRNA (cytidine(1402)-2'-O)-methyltransferase [Brevibacillus choshinensis]
MQVQRSFSTEQSGVLYLVATPIGNLDDMTVRCLETLRSVDVIACEDTRQTRKLLNHFAIDKRTVSYHEHNKEASGNGLLQWLAEGKQIALVSDAGLPAISDPGAELVRDAAAAGFAVIPVPGANAALTALIASGLPTERFVFCGFIGRENKERREELDRLKKYPETLIFYEAPHRIEKTLGAIREAWGNRRGVLARELTKRYEEFVRGTIDELLEWLREGEARGEFCLIVEGYTGPLEEEEADAWWHSLSVIEHVDTYCEQGLNKKEAIKKAADDRGVSKRDVYNEYHRDQAE